MKKRRALLLTLLALLLIIGIPTGFLEREYREERLNQELIAAILDENTPTVLAALKAGANPNLRYNPETTPPSFKERLKQWYDHILHPGNKPEPDYHSTMLIICINKPEQKIITDHPDILEALLKAGADPNATSERQQTALMLAAEGAPRSLRLLLQHGANVHQTDYHGWTALHYGSSGFHGNGETIETLLNAGANVEEKTKHGWTRLYIAFGDLNQEVAETLLRHHANVNFRDRVGNTCLDEARFNSPSGGLPAEWAKFTARLIKAGAKTGKELDAQAANSPKR